MRNEKQRFKYGAPKETYRCLCCERMKTASEYYYSKNSRVWNSSDGKVLICRVCADGIYAEYAEKYDGITALKAVCAMLDWYFSLEIYYSVTLKAPEFSLGIYSRTLNNRQYRGKTFVASIAESGLDTSETANVEDDIPKKWKKEDLQNMNYVISLLGYDPFDDAILSDNDRKFLYNTMSGYCGDDGITSDSHKVQCIIRITQTHLQCKRIDDFVNAELANSDIDDGKVKVLTTAKKQLLDSISKLAQDNNLSSNYSLTPKRGTGTLSQKMLELSKDDFEAARVNLFDIKTSEAMKQIADESNKSIMEQLGLDANDYTDMLKEQRELILNYEARTRELEEENRLMKNRLIEAEKTTAKNNET